MMIGLKVLTSHLNDPKLDEERRQMQAKTTSGNPSMPGMLELLIGLQRAGVVVHDLKPAYHRSEKVRMVLLHFYCRMMVEDRARWVYVRCAGLVERWHQDWGSSRTQWTVSSRWMALQRLCGLEMAICQSSSR